MDDVDSLSSSSYIEDLDCRCRRLDCEEELVGDGARDVIGVGKPEGKGEEGMMGGNKISSVDSGRFAAAVSYEIVMRTSWRMMIVESSERSCNLEGVYAEDGR